MTVFGASSLHLKIPYLAAVIEREVGPLCLSKIKAGHIGGAARRKFGGKKSFDGTRERRILLQGERCVWAPL
jgi:hypothetical protein